MRVSATFDDKDFQRNMKKRIRNCKPNCPHLDRWMKKTLNWFHRQLWARTGMGRSLTGRFPGYTPGYKKRKQEAGKYTGWANIRWTGRYEASCGHRRVRPGNYEYGPGHAGTLKKWRQRARWLQKKFLHIGYTIQERKAIISKFHREYVRKRVINV